MKEILLKILPKSNFIDINGRFYTKENYEDIRNSTHIKYMIENKSLYLTTKSNKFIDMNNEDYERINPEEIVGYITEWNEDNIKVQISDEKLLLFRFDINEYYVGFCGLTSVVNDKVYIEEIQNTCTYIKIEKIICFNLLNVEGVEIMNEKPALLVRYHRENCPELQDIEFFPNGDFVDLRAAENIKLEAGKQYYINLGVSIKLPEGYWGQFVPRSSAFKNWGILQTNSFAVIDESYCGDDDIWKMPVYATRDTEINVNDRICQFRIVKKQPFEIIEVDKLDGDNRGGLGSSGKN